MAELEERLRARLDELKASREQHQQLLAQYRQAEAQLIAALQGEGGAIAELEELLKLVEEEKE